MSDVAAKFDKGKTRYDLIPPEPLEELGKVYSMGAEKYGAYNWMQKGLSFSRVFAAIMRHLWAFWRGEDIDPESGLHHCAHAAFGCLTLIQYGKTHTDNDDRWKGYQQ